METMQEREASKISPARFVATIIRCCNSSKADTAKLRRADISNARLRVESWEILLRASVDITNDLQLIPAATVAAAIARAEPLANGNLTLGAAIANCYREGNKSDQAKTRLRRLLACGELAELCRVLRPMLTLIESRVAQPLDYEHLLKQLVDFGRAAASGNDTWLQRIKAQWAQDFYGQKTEAEAGEAA